MVPHSSFANFPNAGRSQPFQGHLARSASNELQTTLLAICSSEGLIVPALSHARSKAELSKWSMAFLPGPTLSLLRCCLIDRSIFTFCPYSFINPYYLMTNIWPFDQDCKHHWQFKHTMSCIFNKTWLLLKRLNMQRAFFLVKQCFYQNLQPVTHFQL